MLDRISDGNLTIGKGVETTSILGEAGKPSTVMAYQCAPRWWGKGRRVHIVMPDDGPVGHE
jgi:hypothetical protein